MLTKVMQNMKDHVITLVQAFPGSGLKEGHLKDFRSPRHVYVYRTAGGQNRCLVITGCPCENPVGYLQNSLPEFYDALRQQLERGSIDLDLNRFQAFTQEGAVDGPDSRALLEGFASIALSSRHYVNLELAQGMVSVVLCGGKGSRMRSNELPKVCFPCAGIPAINRLLDSIEKAGVREHVVVVGEKGSKVVREVSEVRDTAVFVYQIKRNGTGSAARQAASLLRSQKYKGSVLVVPGDKILHGNVLERFIQTFHESGADVAIMTGEKRYWPDSGRIVFDNDGNPIDIIEKRDIQKLVLSDLIISLMDYVKKIPTARIREEILREVTSESKASLMFPDLWARLYNDGDITREELATLIPESSRRYTFDANSEHIEMGGGELERICKTVNLFVYLFKSEAFFRMIFSLKTENAQQEEYLTDVIRLLARDPERRWKIIPVPVRDGFEVMSFNNPEELHRIEDYYTDEEKNSTLSEKLYERIDPQLRGRTIRPVGEWVNILEEFGSEVRDVFCRIYGPHQDLHAERREIYLQALRKFIRVYGIGHPVLIARSPGRINLMGRHVEHRGGFTNYMAINREVILVAGARNDDIINVHNVDFREFRPRSFSIDAELARLPRDEWLNMINSKKMLEIIQSSRGDWANYFRAAALRLQEKFRGRLLFGFDGVLAGRIPLAAGLSSSSAVVVTAAEALTFINGLSIMPNDFVDMCGEGEWFVGTRGGCGDHAAMKFAEKGNIIHMGFNPIRIERVVPFPEGHVLFILQSHQSAKKSENAMQIYNEKVATYEVAEAIIKAKFPHHAEKIEHFRDINPEKLGIAPHEIYSILLAIPDRISRSELADIVQPDTFQHLETVFSSHMEPAGGYEARRVALFGIAEIMRAQAIPALLAQGDTVEMGRLMNISHDGDRVSRFDGQTQITVDNAISDAMLFDLRDRLAAGDPMASIHFQSGNYGCSTPLIDEMVDTALTIPGVLGAQLSGAGLGGCIMVLVREEAIDSFQKKMAETFYSKHNIPPSIDTCFPIEGSGVITL